MAKRKNPEHAVILKQGARLWNHWREMNPDVLPNLTNSDFAGAVLNGANLHKADLAGSNLADAFLRYVNLIDANLSHSLLKGADFNHSNLSGANLNDADLSSSTLADSDLSHASFIGADLSGSDLYAASFISADLTRANLKRATVGYTSFIDNDLSNTVGLEEVNHVAPSYLGIDTAYRSKGCIPEKFLRGVGVQSSFITFLPSLTNNAIEYYSCFISYSAKDQAFAKRIHADLQEHGVRCWFAPEDLKIGDRIRQRIDESIRLHDKLLLILSKSSINSQWVEQEVETALARERHQGHPVLFPIRLDDTIMSIPSGWPQLLKNTRNIGDFRNWKNYNKYQKAFQKLLSDLKAAEA